MKVRLLTTGEIAECNDSYGARLIEQGKAVFCKEEPIKETPAKEEPKEELFMAKPIPAEEPEETEEPKKQATEIKSKGGRSRKGE